MKAGIKGSVSVWLLLCCGQISAATSGSGPAMSLFDFLGTVVENDGELIDPLTLYDEQGSSAAVSGEDADATFKVDTSESVKASVQARHAPPIQEQHSKVTP